MSFRKKIAAIVTTLALITTTTGCGYSSRWAVRYADEEVSAGIFLYYQMNAFFEAVDKVKKDFEDIDATDTNALKATAIEGKDFVTWVNDEATEKVRMYFAVGKLFDEYELELTQSEEANVDLIVNYYWDQQGQSEAYEKVGIGRNSFRAVNELTYKSAGVFEYIYGEGGTEEYPEDDFMKYLEDNYVRVKYIALSLVDSSGNVFADEFVKKVEDKADEYLLDLKAGDDIDDLIADYSDFNTQLNEEAAPKDETTGTTTEATTEEVTTEEESDETESTTTRVDAVTKTASSDDDKNSSSSSDSSSSGSSSSESSDSDKDSSSDSDSSDSDKDESSTESADDEDTLTTGTDSETEEDPHQNEFIIKKGEGDDADSYSPSKVSNEAFFAAEKNKPTLIKDEEKNMIYVFIIYDISERTDLFTDNEQKLKYLNEILGDKYNEMLLETVPESDITRNASAYKRYSPFDFQ